MPRSVDRPTLPSGILAVFLVLSVAVLSVALPLGLVSSIPDVGRSDAWVITLTIMIWSGVRLSVLWVRGAPNLFDFFFWLFTYIFMGLAPTAQIRADEISTTTPGMDPALDTPTAWVVLAGVAAYEVGRVIWWLSRHRSRPSPPSEAGISPTRVAILFAVGLVFTTFYISRVGVGGAIGSRQAAQAARAAIWPDPSMRAVFYALAVYPMLVCIGALAQLGRRVTNGAVKSVVTVTVAVGVVVLLAVANPVASARYTFGTVAFGLVAYLGALRSEGRVRATLLGVIAAFLFVFPIADAFRTDEVRVSRGGFFDEYLRNPDYDSFWQVANALSFWLDGLVQPLRQFMGSILFWVPRSLWPDKPTDTGILLAEYRGYSFDNLSAPTWAELLVNGGLVALVVGFLVLGPALAAADRRLRLTHLSGGLWMVAGAVLPVYMTILLRGSLLQATGALTVIVACLLWVRRSRSRSDPPASRQSSPYSSARERTLVPGGPSPQIRRDP